MIKLSLIALCLVTVYFSQSDAVLNPKVVCYYESWGYWRQGRGKMTTNDIDSSLCTHLVYAYFAISDNYRVQILDPYLMEDMHDLRNFTNIKGHAKAMIAVGGSTKSDKFSLMASTDADRTSFVDSVVELLKKHNFDGVMIDWQYPKHSDIDNYVRLMDKFDEKFAGTSFSLGITGPPIKSAIDEGYDVKRIINYLDFIHVLTIDLHGLWDSKVDYAAPLDWQVEALRHWWEKGAPKNKLIMSIPMFARTWSLSKPENNERTASASGPGPAGPYTQVAGLLSYNELCSLMKSNPSEWSIRRDHDNVAVYAIRGREWVSYEDSKTCADKAKNATTQGFGGVAAYALTNEDFHGDCTGTKFPLLHGINSGLNHDPVKDSTPPAPTGTTTTIHPTNAHTDAPGTFSCHKAGSFKDPIYCQKYHVCIPTDIPGVWEDALKYCDRTEAFDETAQKCNKKELVPGCH